MSDSTPIPAEQQLMTPREVADFFRVSLSTISRWAQNGQLTVARLTPSGHRRFWRNEVEEIAEPDPWVENWADSYQKAIDADLAEFLFQAARADREETAR